MAKTTRKKPAREGWKQRLAGFVAEQFPFASEPVHRALGSVSGSPENARSIVRDKLADAVSFRPPAGACETTPGVTADQRLKQAAEELLDAVDGFLCRESIAASFTNEERREMLRGMILTRATDNQLKSFFLGSQVRYGGTPFQGKGFRSLGQEAIYAAALRLRRGPDYRAADGSWRGDIVAPLIRDLGAALAMHPGPETVRMVLNAQIGKSGPPMNGKDLHIGDMSRGILPATAPLSISTLTVAGLAMAFARQAEDRVAVHAERLEDLLAHVVDERPLGRARERGAENRVADVRASMTRRSSRM